MILQHTEDFLEVPEQPATGKEWTQDGNYTMALKIVTFWPVISSYLYLWMFQIVMR